jgi:hypothetical protein
LVALTAIDADGWWWTVVLDDEELAQIADLVVQDGWQRLGACFGLEDLRVVVVLIPAVIPGRHTGDAEVGRLIQDSLRDRRAANPRRIPRLGEERRVVDLIAFRSRSTALE